MHKTVQEKENMKKSIRNIWLSVVASVVALSMTSCALLEEGNLQRSLKPSVTIASLVYIEGAKTPANRQTRIDNLKKAVSILEVLTDPTTETVTAALKQCGTDTESKRWAVTVLSAYELLSPYVTGGEGTATGVTLLKQLIAGIKTATAVE